MSDSGAGANDRLGIGDEHEFFSLINLELPAMADVRTAVEAEDWDAAKSAWAKHLRERKTPRWVWSHRDRARIKKALDEQFDGLANQVPRAEKVLRREFGWLGVNRTLTHDIDWYKPVEYEHEWGNVLNRHGYWRTLALAWWETGDAKYAEDWVFMLNDWIDDNPVKPMVRGPWRTLEVGGRCVLWFHLMYMFMDAPAFDADTKYAMTRSLVEHARLLYADITRKGYRPGNWQLTKSRGMATVGVMLPEFKEAKAWRELGFKTLGEHMRSGVYPDGGHSELTPGYHFHCMNAFHRAIVLARINGHELGGLAERHERMFEFLLQLTKPDRAYVPVGDAGSGWSAKILESMSLGALLYGRQDMRYLGSPDIRPSWVWMFEQDRLAEYADMPAKVPTLLSHMMPHSKYGVMRTGWEKNDRWFLFDCAPWGGSHSHGDRLQVCLYAGRDLLIDPGQYSYDQPLAKTYFRSAQAHNVLLLNEKDQPRSDPQVLTWNIRERVEFASARIVTKDWSITHQRSVLFVKPDYWVVVDHVTGKGDPSLTRQFHFPVVKVEHDASSVRTCFEQGENVWVGKADDARLEMRKGWVPISQTKAVEAPVAAFVSRQPLPAALCTVLVPFSKDSDIPQVQRLPSDDPGTVTIGVRFKDGRTDWIAIGPEATEFKGPHTGTGIAVCVRAHDDKSTVDVIRPEDSND